MEPFLAFGVYTDKPIYYSFYRGGEAYSRFLLIAYFDEIMMLRGPSPTANPEFDRLAELAKSINAERLCELGSSLGVLTS